MENTPVTPQNRKATTDSEARTAKPEAKEYKLSFGGGLYLLVKPNGLKYWRMKYRFKGVEKSPFALGVYPQVSLKDARKQQASAKELLAQGIDPSEAKRIIIICLISLKPLDINRLPMLHHPTYSPYAARLKPKAQ